MSNGPVRLDITSGETAIICTCGNSQTFPRCDGSHGGTGKKPHIEKFNSNRTVFVCSCLKTGNSPFCDGSHNK